MNRNYYTPPQGDNGNRFYDSDKESNSAAAVPDKPKYNSYVKVKKNVEPMTKRDSVFMLLLFVSTFIFVDFAVFHGFNLGFTIAFFVLFAVVTAYLCTKRIRPSVFSCVCGALSLAGAVTLAVFRDVFINCIMVFLTAVLFTIYTCGLSGTFRSKEGSIKMLADVFSGVFISPLANLFDSAQAFSKSVSANKKILNAVIGAAVSIPVLLVVVPLLASGDAAFEGLISMVFKNIGIYLGEFLIAVILTPFIVSYAFSKKRNLKTGSEFASKNYSNLRFSPNVVSVSFLSAISFVYIVFLFSQLAYFFSAFSGILPEGYEFNASGYARRGFFEMFAICVINISIISLANICTKRLENNKPSVAIRILSAFISLFSVLLLITAMAKMKLYIDHFGLTKYRLLVSVFMIMLVVIVFFYVLHIFAPKVNYMQPVVIICSVIFIVVSFADMDKFIAEYDVKAYQSGKLSSVDVDYLNELTASATPYLIELTKCDDAKISEKAKLVISQNIHYKYNDMLTVDESNQLVYKPDFDFREYNFAVDNSCKEYCEYYNSLTDEEKSSLDISYQGFDAAVGFDDDSDKYVRLVNDFVSAPDDDYVFYLDKNGDYYCGVSSRDMILTPCFYEDDSLPSYVALKHQVFMALADEYNAELTVSLYDKTEEYENQVTEKLLANTSVDPKIFEEKDSEFYYAVNQMAFDMAYLDYYKELYPNVFNDENAQAIIADLRTESD